MCFTREAVEFVDQIKVDKVNFPPLEATKALRVGTGIALPFLRPRH